MKSKAIVRQKKKKKKEKKEKERKKEKGKFGHGFQRGARHQDG
jgi:hypothetical protein